jgi:hypothetical protein
MEYSQWRAVVNKTMSELWDPMTEGEFKYLSDCQLLTKGSTGVAQQTLFFVTRCELEIFKQIKMGIPFPQLYLYLKIKSPLACDGATYFRNKP